MKDLNEVINEMTNMNKEDRCMYCPFDWEDNGDLVCTRGNCVYDDALHYLKEYKWNQENPDGDHQQLVKAQALLQDMFSNEPLTWQELKQMEGKPVWVEMENSVCKKGWFLINYCSGNELHLISINGGSYCLHDFISDIWQAYRKERK